MLPSIVDKNVDDLGSYNRFNSTSWKSSTTNDRCNRKRESYVTIWAVDVLFTVTRDDFQLVTKCNQLRLPLLHCLPDGSCHSGNNCHFNSTAAKASSWRRFPNRRPGSGNHGEDHSESDTKSSRPRPRFSRTRHIADNDCRIGLCLA
jgi:hypothetical protein